MPIGMNVAAPMIGGQVNQYSQPNYAQTLSSAYGLANEQMDVEQKQKGIQESQADKAALQEYLKSGGDLYSQEGIDQAVQQLKGRVSPQMYMNLTKHGQEFQQWSNGLAESAARLPAEQLQGVQLQNNFILQQLEGASEAYNQGVAKRLAEKGYSDPKTAPTAEVAQAKQDALADFQAAKQARLKYAQSLQGPGGKPVIDPKLMQQFQGMDPDAVDQAVKRTSFYNDRVKAALDAQYKQSEIAKNNAAAAAPKGVAEQLAKIDELERNGTLPPEQAAAARAKLTAVTGSGAANAPPKPFEQLDPTSQKAIDAAAWNKIMDGKDPPARGGMYGQTMAYIEDIAKANNVSVQDLMTASADLKARFKAKASLEQRITNISRAENVLDSELPNLEQNMKAVDLSKYPAISHLDLAYLRMKGDPNVVKMDQSAGAIFNEFEGIVTGNVGGALNVSDVQKAREDYYHVQTPQGMQAWIDNAKAMIERAKKANEKTRREFMEGIRDVVPSRSPLHPEGGTSQPNATGASPFGFPKVSPETQRDRDTGSGPAGSAQSILAQELAKEKPGTDNYDAIMKEMKAKGFTVPMATQKSASGKMMRYVGRSESNPSGWEYIPDSAQGAAPAPSRGASGSY